MDCPSDDQVDVALLPPPGGAVPQNDDQDDSSDGDDQDDSFASSDDGQADSSEDSNAADDSEDDEDSEDDDEAESGDDDDKDDDDAEEQNENETALLVTDLEDAAAHNPNESTQLLQAPLTSLRNDKDTDKNNTKATVTARMQRAINRAAAIERMNNRFNQTGRYVEALEEFPLPPEEIGAQDPEEAGATEVEPSAETGAQLEVEPSKETGARHLEEEVTFDPPEQQPLFHDDMEEQIENDSLDNSDSSSIVYERGDVALAHMAKERQLLCSVPRRIGRFALAKFLENAYRDDRKYWWRYVPEKLQNTADVHRCMHLLLGNQTFNVLLNQMTAKSGIKKHGELAIAALVKELSHNLHIKDVIEGKMFNELTQEQRAKALRAIALTKEKRDGQLKGRVVADGRPQREWTDPDSVYSPTVSCEGMILSLGIDAHEKRFVSVCDIDGAYLHAFMDKFVLMVFEGDLADMLVRACPMYAKYLHVTKTGKKLLYVRLKRALYGCIKSAMLWWLMLSEFLIEDGFELNPYDSCVANKTLSCGTQIAICWYVDDLKILSKNEQAVHDIIKKLEDRFGAMRKSFGKKHTYLGMEVEFCDDGSVRLSVPDHIKECIKDFGEDLGRSAANPASKKVFHVDPDAERLPEPKRKLLHSLVQKLLWVTKRCRPDIMVPIAFLTGRVQKASVEDWGKLRRVLSYLDSTIDMPLTIKIDDLTIVKTWVDVAFAVHEDFKSHTGNMISMGKGALYARSMKQKLNTTSTTESETVGASDCLGQTIWTMNFLEHQGIRTRRRYYYQDDESAMRLEKNGRQSASKRSRHIDIRFFFIKDRIKRGDIHLLYCPTEDMLADFFSKPQQGSLYKRFRDMVMGITPVPPVEDPSFTCPTSQERVGSSIFGAGGRRTDGEIMTKMARPTVTWADRVRGFAGGIARPESLGPAHKNKKTSK